MSFRLFARYILGSGFACDFILPQNLRKVAKLTHGGPIHQNNASNERHFQPEHTPTNYCIIITVVCQLDQGVYYNVCIHIIYIFTLDIVYMQGERRESLYYF